jgi:uncharacterized membrane protein
MPIRDHLTKQNLIHIAVLPSAIFVITAVILAITYSPTRALPNALGMVYLVFLPGYVFSFLLWPIEKITQTERVVASFALSLVCVPLVMFLLAKSGAEINRTNTIWEVFGILVVLGLLILARYGWWQFTLQRASQKLRPVKKTSRKV